MQTLIRSTVENTANLTTDEQLAVKCCARWSPGTTIDEVESVLKVFFPHWTVYRGGSHIALIKESGSPRNMILEFTQETQVNVMDQIRTQEWSLVVESSGTITRYGTDFAKKLAEMEVFDDVETAAAVLVDSKIGDVIKMGDDARARRYRRTK